MGKVLGLVDTTCRKNYSNVYFILLRASSKDSQILYSYARKQSPFGFTLHHSGKSPQLLRSGDLLKLVFLNIQKHELFEVS